MTSINSTNNNKYEAFGQLPSEVSELIFSKMDPVTLINTAHAFLGNSYEVGNRVAGQILEQKGVAQLNKEENLKDLNCHLQKYCALLSEIYNKHLSDNLPRDIEMFEEAVKANPQTLNDWVCNKFNSHNYNYTNEVAIEIPALLDAGAKIPLENFLDLALIPNVALIPNLVPNLVRRIIKHNDPQASLYISDLVNSIREQYPMDILESVASKVNNKQQWILDSDMSIICSSQLKETVIIDTIKKIPNWPSYLYNLLLSTTTLSETLLMGLIDNIDLTNCNKDLLERLERIMMRLVFKDSTYSFKPLIKLMDLCTSLKVQYCFSGQHELNPQNYEYYLNIDEYFNDEFLISYAKNQLYISPNLLEKAVSRKVSPTAVLKLYERVFKPYPGGYDEMELKIIRWDALNYIFKSGQYSLIYDLIQMGEYPSSEAVLDAIDNHRGENLINLLLDGYERKKNNEEGGPWDDQYPCYSRMLPKAIRAGLSDEIVERIRSHVQNNILKDTLDL